jgi:CHASE3 domain sensor protein
MKKFLLPLVFMGGVLLSWFALSYYQLYRQTAQVKEANVAQEQRIAQIESFLKEAFSGGPKQ